MRIGIDVGGTNTDAVLMDGRRVRAWRKTATTDNVSSGIITAITEILTQSKVSPADIECVMIGTTHFTNAFVERRHLLPVGIIRIALPATRGLPPLVDWPADLHAAIGDHVFMVRGGYQYDGRINSALDETAIADAARAFRARGISTVAISALFSPVNGHMEDRAEAILRDIIPDVRITQSHKIGRLGLLERENAAVMNASLADLSTKVVTSFRKALLDLKITAPFFISQNDGTLMSAEFVEKYPVLTFASGPTNSMRGAAYLSGIKDALVVDIGGTTTDIGLLANGFPRESSVTVDIGGVRTNFRMPDIFAIGLGGGSLVSPQDPSVIGPQSVGFRLSEKALVFGGDSLTATDIAVAAGYADIGEAARVSHLPPALVETAVARIHRIVEEGIDRMKTSAAEMPLILVGGGAVLISRPIAGVSDMIVPEFASVANAIGAAIAQVGGEVDHVYYYAKTGRENSLADARDKAIRATIDAGAAPGTVSVLDLEEIPLAYVPGGAVRIRVKAAGKLSLTA
ncbi:hydantoinase/oxoprolinase family protein [Govanella unica]|uniref:Hydantoinase/oxoprolinase family protein n=1 Tax=Govanella unica TaxID=2975056 RepID=A0A9X3TYI0_9PROT|nr:hydantoinase/oxoprolinase family protein [Govania unica]MDA5194126.1 hydantoinase/oxoprolinase family protein [Govania unica]